MIDKIITAGKIETPVEANGGKDSKISLARSTKPTGEMAASKLGFSIRGATLGKGESITTAMEYSMDGGKTWAVWSSVTLRGGFNVEDSVFVCTPPPDEAMIRMAVDKSNPESAAGTVAFVEAE